MSAPRGSLFLAFALYCSHTAKTYTRLKSLITQSMEITNARSHIAFYWPLKSNLGTSIKAETLVPLTLLSPTALGLGTLEHLLYYRAFLPDAWQMAWYLPKGPLIFTWSLWKSSVVNISSEIANSHVPAPEGWCARALFGPMAELNSKLSLRFILFFFSADLGLYERGRESKQQDPIPFPLVVLAGAPGSDNGGVSLGSCVKFLWKHIGVLRLQPWVGYSLFSLWMNMRISEHYFSCTILVVEFKRCFGSDSRAFPPFQGFVLPCDGCTMTDEKSICFSVWGS